MDPPNLLVDQGVCCAMSLLVVSETKPMKSHQRDHPSMSGARTTSIDIQSGKGKPEGLNPIPRHTKLEVKCPACLNPIIRTAGLLFLKATDFRLYIHD